MDEPPVVQEKIPTAIGFEDETYGVVRISHQIIFVTRQAESQVVVIQNQMIVNIHTKEAVGRQAGEELSDGKQGGKDDIEQCVAGWFPSENEPADDQRIANQKHVEECSFSSFRIGHEFVLMFNHLLLPNDRTNSQIKARFDL